MTVHSIAIIIVAKRTSGYFTPSGVSTLILGTVMKKGELFKRFSALALDLPLFYFAAKVAGFHHGGLVFLWIFYETVSVAAWQGATIGKKIKGLRVVTTAQKPVPWPKALVRSLAKPFSAVVFLLGGLGKGQKGKMKVWHDSLAGTVVVSHAH